jgi:hypothetical protein
MSASPSGGAARLGAGSFMGRREEGKGMVCFNDQENKASAG